MEKNGKELVGMMLSKERLLVEKMDSEGTCPMGVFYTLRTIYDLYAKRKDDIMFFRDAKSFVLNEDMLNYLGERGALGDENFDAEHNIMMLKSIYYWFPKISVRQTNVLKAIVCGRIVGFSLEMMSNFRKRLRGERG